MQPSSPTRDGSGRVATERRTPPGACTRGLLKTGNSQTNRAEDFHVLDDICQQRARSTRRAALVTRQGPRIDTAMITERARTAAMSLHGVVGARGHFSTTLSQQCYTRPSLRMTPAACRRRQVSRKRSAGVGRCQENFRRVSAGDRTQPVHVVTHPRWHANTPHTPSGTHMCQETCPAGVGRCHERFLAGVARCLKTPRAKSTQKCRAQH